MADLKDSEFYTELKAAVQAAERAGEIMDQYRDSGKISFETKDGINDIVTEADLECQDEIVEIISEQFPGDDFKTEEGLNSDEDSDRVWVIDPIDGTTNFKSGWTYFCTSIALKIKEDYMVGVVHSPESGLGRTWVAVRGAGSYVIGEKFELENLSQLQVSEREDIQTGFFTCFQDPDNDSRRRIEQELITDLTSRDMNYRECASGALMLPEIAEGGLDARFDFVNEWDYAAASLILEEAGGRFEKIEERFGKDTVVASNGNLHREFREAAKRAIEGE